jgi:hypothetical protein
MRLGLVEKGNYKTTDYPDLTGYRLEVNGLMYDFGRMLEETRYRVQFLWGFECPPDLLRHRLHFSEELFFNRMIKNEHYGVFNRHTGANICLGLVAEPETCDLIIHEIAHEMHYRQGYYDQSDEYVQEGLAIMTEQEFGRRTFEFNPHFSAQQLIDQLMELPGFGPLPFLERWEILSKVGGIVQLSYLINRYLDDRDGEQLRTWLDWHCPGPDEARHIANALAQTSQFYALYNRRLLLRRFVQLGNRRLLDRNQIHGLVRALGQLRELDQRFPNESLTNLMEHAFSRI